VRRPRGAIIPTYNRPDVLLRCVNAIGPQVDILYIINNGEELPDETFDQFNVNVVVNRSKVSPPNLSLFWNQGLNFIQGYVTSQPSEDMYAWLGVPVESRGLPATEWDVAILNDDAIVPEGWFDAVSEAMRNTQGAAGCSGPVSVVHRDPGPVPLHTRLFGPAYIVAGELGLRGNEDIKWWYTDDWMDWESRKLGGTVMVTGFQVQHLHPNGNMTPELQVQAAKDGEKFREIYGMAPW
jgi:glycosyltransferase involved in cell wall biosynthesis